MHITLLGVDGSGKSTLLNDLYLKLRRNYDFINSPDFHEVVGAGFSELSKALCAFSQVADELRAPQVKVLAMFLQVSLFERLEKNCKKNKIISFRHPLIDSLVYSSFYHKYLQSDVSRKKIDATIKKTGQQTIIYSYIDHFCQSHAIRNIKELSELLQSMSNMCFEDFFVQLSNLLRVELPDKAILLEIPTNEALGRLSKREQSFELHESFEGIDIISKAYQKVLKQLVDLHKTNFSYTSLSITNTFNAEVVISLIKKLRCE